MDGRNELPVRVTTWPDAYALLTHLADEFDKRRLFDPNLPRDRMLAAMAEAVRTNDQLAELVTRLKQGPSEFLFINLMPPQALLDEERMRAAIAASRRRDPELKARVERRMADDRPVLDRLREDDGRPCAPDREQEEIRIAAVQELVHLIDPSSLRGDGDASHSRPPLRAYLRPGAWLVVGATLWAAALTGLLTTIEFATPIAILLSLIAIPSGALRWQVLSLRRETPIDPDALPPLALIHFAIRLLAAQVVFSLALGPWPFGLALRAILAIAGAICAAFAFRELSAAARLASPRRRI